MIARLKLNFALSRVSSSRPRFYGQLALERLNVASLQCHLLLLLYFGQISHDDDDDEIMAPTASSILKS